MTDPANPNPPAAPACIIGCDVGKADIAVFDSATGQGATIANTPDALDAFAAALPPGCLVVCEATGGYEAALLDAVLRAGHAAHRADARRVKAFIRSLGTLAKTDALDARALARYGQERHDRLERWCPRDEHRQRLATLVATRSDIVRARTACTNRLKAPGADPRQSGTVDAYRRTRGGRPDVRRVLFMAALSATRFNPVIAQFYKRLRDNGKKPIVALTAAMRKLITIANAKSATSSRNN